MIKRAISVVVAGGVALGGLAGLVWTAGSAAAQRDFSTTPAASTAAAPDGTPPSEHRGIRAIHGDLIVRQADGTFGPATMDRGKVSAKSSSGFTLVRPDGVTVSVTVGDATKYRGVANFDALQVGKPAVAVVKNGVAVMVGQPLPKDERRANRANRQANQAPAQA